MPQGEKRRTGLTANAVKHVRPRENAYKLSDLDGLYLLVKPTGVRYWRMNYRFNGQQRTLSFGRWPELLLGEARTRLLDARRLIANGIDPVEQGKIEKIAQSISATDTFEAVAKEWLEKIEKEGLAAITLPLRSLEDITEALSARTKLISTKQVQPQPLPMRADGTIPIEELHAAVKNDDPHFAITRQVAIENSFAGRALPREYLAEVAEFARERKLATHLDVDRAAGDEAIAAAREIAERRR